MDEEEEVVSPTIASGLTSAPHLSSIPNFRDVGVSINAFLGGTPILVPGLLYRSGSPGEATAAERQRLYDEFQIRTVVDLRTDSERVEQARQNSNNDNNNNNNNNSHRHSRPDPSRSPATATATSSVPPAHKAINLNGAAYTRALITQLSLWQGAELAARYIWGDRIGAIRVVGANVMASRGLEGLAEDSLRHGGAEVKAIFDLLSTSPSPSPSSSYPLLLHCTQGKDRTGLVVLLVLLLLRVPRAAIAHDYERSAAELAPTRADRVRRIGAIGLPEGFADCAPGWCARVADWLERECGGVEAYLAERCGVGREQQARVMATLRVDGGGDCGENTA